MNIKDIKMYLRYYKKCTFLFFLKVFQNLDFKGRLEDRNPLLRGYEGCYPVRKLLSKLNINEKDSILDIGCGKGLFLYYARKFNFNKIVGIEYSENLSNIAKNNFSLINDKRIRVINIDARLFSYYEDYNYFFINNPFSAEIMDFVIDNIIENRKSTVTVIYQFPFSKELFIKKGFKVLLEKYPNIILQYEPKLCII